MLFVKSGIYPIIKLFSNRQGQVYAAMAFLFPKIITVNAFAVLIISDSTAALFGRRFGRRKFLQKSLAGAVAFFCSAVIVVLVTPKIEGIALEYLIGIIGAAVGAVIESASTKFDDNISIPLGIGLVTWALYQWLLPAVNIYGIG